jgi:hypothetical protein
MGYDLETMGSEKSKKREDKNENKRASRLAFYFEGREKSEDS